MRAKRAFAEPGQNRLVTGDRLSRIVTHLRERD